MERTYESTAALVGRAAGPVANHLGPFVTSLIDQQYAASVIYIKARHALAFDRWLAKRRVVLADLGEVQIERYQRRSRRRRQRIRTETRRREWYEVTQLLQFLRGRGVCLAARVETTAADDLAARYGQHLRDQQGLATATIERYRTVVGRFLHERFGNGAVNLRALRNADVIVFVQRQTQRLQPPALKCVVSAMRSFLRYAQYRSEVDPRLVAAVPVVAAWTTTPPVPKAISPEHAQRAIDSCDPSTAVGLRDHAVLLLLARLGLRAHEIIALRLEDCDWDSGHLRVRGKSGREQLLPMPVDVGVRCGRGIGFDLVPRSPLNSVQSPPKANSGRSSLSANQTTSLLFGLRVRLWRIFREAVCRDQATVFRFQPAAPVRGRRVPDVDQSRDLVGMRGSVTGGLPSFHGGLRGLTGGESLLE